MPYRLALTPEFANVHDVFHVSILKKCIVDPIHVLDQPPIELERNLQYKEQLVRIVDSRVERVRNKVIPLVKVWWVNLLVRKKVTCGVSIYTCLNKVQF